MDHLRSHGESTCCNPIEEKFRTSESLDLGRHEENANRLLEVFTEAGKTMLRRKR